MCDISTFKDAIHQPEINKVGIVLHDTPDPDCIASALGIDFLLKHWKEELKTTFIYSGEISHSQNKTLVNVLNLNLTPISEIVEQELSSFDALVAVDVIPERTCMKEHCNGEFLATIDHHRNETNMSRFADIRATGSSSAVVWDYLKVEGIEFDKSDEKLSALATALVVGIKTDTADLTSENTTDLDHDAFRHLMAFVNQRHLSSIISYPIPAYYFDLRSWLDQEENTKTDNGVFVGGVGLISPAKRDALPMMAEERARLEGIETAFVFGIVGDNIEVSVRSVGLSVGVNGLCQKIFGKQYAGGKMGAGAAKIPLGFLSASKSPAEIQENLWKAIKDFLIDKIFHVVSGNV